MGTWFNSDGLKIDLGITEASDQNLSYPDAGEYKTFGPVRIQETVIDLTKLAAFGTTGILSDKVFFGKNWVVERVEIETLVACTGATATLSLGTRQSDRVTDISTTAFASAVPVATIAAVGTKLLLTAGSTGAGNRIGVNNTIDALWTATVGTANFTAGVIRVRVEYRPINPSLTNYTL
jgi:hypothetical protein